MTKPSGFGLNPLGLDVGFGQSLFSHTLMLSQGAFGVFT